jgi:hypothetical protein
MLLTPTLLTLALVAAPALTDANLPAIHDAVRPTAAELAYESIPWLPTAPDGVRAAREQDRPLLLWAMNGHPLGCV